MKALVLTQPGKIEISEVSNPGITQDQVLIKMKAVALNKRDQFIREGKYPNIQLGTVLGSDGVGEIIEIGKEVDPGWMGRHVIVNPNLNWGDDDQVQSREYSILGMPTNGTMAEYLAVDVDRVQPVPAHLDTTKAAVIPLAGLTAYRACFHHGKISKGVNVLISGFGGGVAQFAFQFALAAGANVFITSSSQEKIDKAIALGAAGGFNYNEPAWHKNLWQTKGGFDVVIDSAGGDQINNFIKIMRPAGRIVFFGATNGLPKSLDLYRMFWNQITLQGSTMGSDREFEDMLAFMTQHKIEPLVDSVRPFGEIVSAFDDIALSTKLGKLVVELE